MSDFIARNIAGIISANGGATVLPSPATVAATLPTDAINANPHWSREGSTAYSRGDRVMVWHGRFARVPSPATVQSAFIAGSRYVSVLIDSPNGSAADSARGARQSVHVGGTRKLTASESAATAATASPVKSSATVAASPATATATAASAVILPASVRLR